MIDVHLNRRYRSSDGRIYGPFSSVTEVDGDPSMSLVVCLVTGSMFYRDGAPYIPYRDKDLMWEVPGEGEPSPPLSLATARVRRAVTGGAVPPEGKFMTPKQKKAAEEEDRKYRNERVIRSFKLGKGKK
jgi:hypothetical protein